MTTKFVILVDDKEMIALTDPTDKCDFGRYLACVDTVRNVIRYCGYEIVKQIDAVITEHDMTTHQTLFYTE